MRMGYVMLIVCVRYMGLPETVERCSTVRHEE